MLHAQAGTDILNVTSSGQVLWGGRVPVALRFSHPTAKTFEKCDISDLPDEMSELCHKSIDARHALLILTSLFSLHDE
jgi:hypothetical protein